jgi:hypothetical protein
MSLIRREVPLYNLVDRTIYPSSQGSHYRAFTYCIKADSLHQYYNIILTCWEHIVFKYDLFSFFQPNTYLLVPRFLPIPKIHTLEVIVYKLDKEATNIFELFELPFFNTKRNPTVPGPHIPRRYTKRIKKLQNFHFSTLDVIHPWDHSNNILSCYDRLVDLSELSCHVPFLLKTRGFTVCYKTRFIPYHISEVRPSFDGILPIIQELRIPTYVRKLRFTKAAQFQFPKLTYWGWNYSEQRLGSYRENGYYIEGIDHSLLSDFTKWEEERAHTTGYDTAWGISGIPYDAEDFTDEINGRTIIHPKEIKISKYLFAKIYHKKSYQFFITHVEKVFNSWRSIISRALARRQLYIERYNQLRGNQYSTEQIQVHIDIDYDLIDARAAARSSSRRSNTPLSEDEVTDLLNRSPTRSDRSYHGQTDLSDQYGSTDEEEEESDRSHNGSPVPIDYDAHRTFNRSARTIYRYRRQYQSRTNYYSREESSLDRRDIPLYPEEPLGEIEEAGF